MNAAELRAGSLRAGEDHLVTFRIAQPAFPLIRTDMVKQRPEDLRPQRLGPYDGGAEILNLKPQEQAVPVGPSIGVPDRAVVVLDVPPVQLQHKRSVLHQPLIVRAAVPTLTAEQLLIPPAHRLDVVHTNEGLGAHVGECRPSRAAWHYPGALPPEAGLRGGYSGGSKRFVVL